MTSLVAVDVLQVSVWLTESSIAPNERSRNRFELSRPEPPRLLVGAAVERCRREVGVHGVALSGRGSKIRASRLSS